ncbi:hypothetical protein HPB47_000746 [Ixodes persulcatus]|uniref:Uncharacterized protein n=1 Tax=Ixodes persulcatus TaxID=34615 RepID=A0AC60PQW3_IXOPE|nr:hypothetical protein HPB47_000746 [Ixodes persulcatus]
MAVPRPSVLQPLNISVNKLFKENLRQEYEEWTCSPNQKKTTTGKLQKTSPSTVASWILDAWKRVCADVVVKSFKNEHASQDQADEGGDSTDDEHHVGEVPREESLEEAVISEDDDDEEMGPGSIEDLLTLCVEEFGASMLPHSPTSKAGAIAMVMSYAVSERSTWAGLGKLLTLVNALFGSEVLPTSIYKLRKLWTKTKEDLVKYHYLCPSCDTVLNSSDSIARCDVCKFEESTEKLRRGGSYFLMLDLHKQLKHLIGKTSVELHHSLSKLALNDSDLITDITTAEACKHLRQELALGCVRYVADEAPLPRTSELVVRDMELARRLGNPVNGIKGPSPLMNLEGFDLVAGMSVEYMHCVLQGVVRQVTELLFSSTSSRQAYYIAYPEHALVVPPRAVDTECGSRDRSLSSLPLL